MDDKALVPAVKVLMIVDLHAQFLQHGLVCALSFSVHGSAHVVQDAHDAWRILTQNVTMVTDTAITANRSTEEAFHLIVLLTVYFLHILNTLLSI